MSRLQKPLLTAKSAKEIQWVKSKNPVTWAGLWVWMYFDLNASEPDLRVLKELGDLVELTYMYQPCNKGTNSIKYLCGSSICQQGNDTQ